MDVKIQSVNFDADAKLEGFIQSRLEKLEQFFDNIISAKVYLKVDKAESKDNKIVEVKLGLPGRELFASKQGDSFEEAADESMEALRRQVIKFKEKIMAKH